MNKIKFNSYCAMVGTGFLHGFFSSQCGILAVIEIEEAKSYNTARGLDGCVNMEYRGGQIVTCDAQGIDIIRVNGGS